MPFLGQKLHDDKDQINLIDDCGILIKSFSKSTTEQDFLQILTAIWKHLAGSNYPTNRQKNLVFRSCSFLTHFHEVYVGEVSQICDTTRKRLPRLSNSQAIKSTAMRLSIDTTLTFYAS